MEKRYPVDGDLPPIYIEEYNTLSKDVLVKTKSGIYVIAFFDWSSNIFVENLGGNNWFIEDIECWWYLPE